MLFIVYGFIARLVMSLAESDGDVIAASDAQMAVRTLAVEFRFHLCYGCLCLSLKLQMMNGKP